MVCPVSCIPCGPIKDRYTPAVIAHRPVLVPVNSLPASLEPYYNFGIGHGFDLPKGMALGLSASVGLNQHQWIEITTVTDVVLGVSWDIPMGDMVTLSPFYNYITGNKSLRTCDGCFYYTGSIGGVNLNISC